MHQFEPDGHDYLTTLETRRFRGDQIEVFKVLNGYENIDRNILFPIKEEKGGGLEDIIFTKNSKRMEQIIS